MFKKINVTIVVFPILIVLLNMNNNMAFASQVITILSGASDTGGQVLFDTTFYSLKRNTQLVWLNNDSVGHRIIITAENGTLLFDSGIIKPKNSFSHIFYTPGTYHFSSPDFSNKYGTIVVTDDMYNIVASHLRNNVDIQLTRYPLNQKWAN
jgi:plastocyanin